VPRCCRIRSPEARDYLEHIWDMPTKQPQRPYPGKLGEEGLTLHDSLTLRPWEFGAYYYATLEKPLYERVALVPRLTIDHPHATFIRHLWSKVKRGSPNVEEAHFRPPEYVTELRRALKSVTPAEVQHHSCALRNLTLDWAAL
jgi:hypothetical protein